MIIYSIFKYFNMRVRENGSQLVNGLGDNLTNNIFVLKYIFLLLFYELR